MERLYSTNSEEPRHNTLVLDEGSYIGVIGGGPAGSFFSYFILQMAQRIGMRLQVDIYERRDFNSLGPTGCNMCGGVISESLVQALSVEGINLPHDVVQRGIDSFLFHTEKETVNLYAPFREMRIATVYRGAGPKGTSQPRWQSFDRYLLEKATDSGARLICDRVTDIGWIEGKPQVHTKDGQPQVYDLVVGALGVNTPSLGLFEKLGIGYEQPKTRKTSNVELELGSSHITTKLGNSMHAFLLDLPNLDFAALIPKGDYVTMCLIGDNITTGFVDSFVQNPVVGEYLASKSDYGPGACRCAPLASLGDAVQPFGDRVVLIGDCAMARLNKDGIGSAYRVAKVAAVTALFRGVSDEDFRRGYWPICRTISNDNRYGRIIYRVVDIIKKRPLLKHAVMRMAANEQKNRGKQRRMSSVLWDMFTGSSSYHDVFFRCIHPGFWTRLFLNIITSIFVSPRSAGPVNRGREELMGKITLGKDYHVGEIIVHQGEIGDCMYVIQAGRAEVIQSNEGQEVRLAVLGEGDIFGEMAIFQKERRSATVRALTDVSVLTVDRRILLRRVHEDPSFVFAILQKMSQRIRDLNQALVHGKT
jgi:flavin-dependent dehydrogenase